MKLGTPESSATLINESEQPLDQEVAQISAEEQAQIDWEKRFKDTQAAYTKSRQEIAELKAKLTVSGVGDTIPLVIPEGLREELEDLKYSDPEAWRKQLGALEKEQQTKYNDTIAQMTELEHRELTFMEFSASHPDIVLTDDVIQNHVPSGITKRLERGEITFEQFLQESYDFLKAPKVIGDGNKTLEQPNLSKVGGGAMPSDSVSAKLVVDSYRNEVY
jgi:hypothetical protein